MYQLKPRSIDDLLISVTDTATLLFSLVDTASSAQNSKAYYGNERSPGDGVANAVSIRAEDGDVRIAIGATPTATKGFQIKQGTRYFFHGELENLKLIRTGSANVAVEIAFWRAERGENVTGNTDAVTLTTGDIEIGAVELKDGTNDTRATISVPADASSNAVAGLVVDAKVKGFNGTTWDRIKAGITACTATLTGWLNTLPWAVYNATPTTRTEAQGGPLQTDSNGALHQNLFTKIAGEDLTNDLQGVQNKPVPVSTYAWSVDKSAALEASSIAKATAGVLRYSSFRLDSTAPTATYYLQTMNSATLPADGAVTLLCAPTKIVHVQGVDDAINLDFSMNGIYGSAGIVTVLSSTEFTKTISGAYLSGTNLYI